MKKILYGVCGIGNGHTQRQLPLIEHFAKDCQIVIFAYDSSFNFYLRHFKNHPNITVLEVAVPFYVGNKDGIDLDATRKLPSNNKDYDGVNGKAAAIAEKIIGVPDIVITDYEPISAQYAYARNVPLITIDQQSKYLAGEFPTELNGETYADEVARLRMFFPTAVARIACSFFDVTRKKDGEEVLIVPPIIKDTVLGAQNSPKTNTSLLVYLSSQKDFPQSQSEITAILSRFPDVEFHVFAPTVDGYLPVKNVSFYPHGDDNFDMVLESCSGIVSTAGHTLLSEALYLGVPIYTIPLSVYEQQMNAGVIERGGFGIKSDSITRSDLERFVKNLPKFRDLIKKDTTILLRGSGKEKIIDIVEHIK